MKKLTAKEAAAQLRNLTKQERARIDAFLLHNRYDLAAKAVGCDQETVSSTWKRYSHLIQAVIAAIHTNDNDLDADDF
jgi:hypothetical protein